MPVAMFNPCQPCCGKPCRDPFIIDFDFMGSGRLAFASFEYYGYGDPSQNTFAVGEDGSCGTSSQYMTLTRQGDKVRIVVEYVRFLETFLPGLVAAFPALNVLGLWPEGQAEFGVPYVVSVTHAGVTRTETLYSHTQYVLNYDWPEGDDRFQLYALIPSIRLYPVRTALPGVGNYQVDFCKFEYTVECSSCWQSATRAWTFTMPAVGNFNCQDCGGFVGTWTLEPTPYSSCFWYGPEIPMLDCFSPPFVPNPSFPYPYTTSYELAMYGEYVTLCPLWSHREFGWRLPMDQWDCQGPNTMTLFGQRSVNIFNASYQRVDPDTRCHDWPETVTLEPVL